jgi:P4 family phage/plasmid primase-like protien
LSFDNTDFDHLLAVLGRADDQFVRIGWATHEADFRSMTVARGALSDYIAGLLNAEKPANIYFEINPSDHQGKGRTAAHEVTRLAALWADIDFKGNGMGNEDGARALVDELSRALGAEPAAIVYSGGGCQPYWLLENATSEQYGVEQIAALSKRWGSLVKRFALELGGAADGVFDLARVFRVPGTVNIKYGTPKPVTVEFAERATTWTVEEIAEILDDWGVVDVDTGLSDVVLSAESDWKWADEDCHFVATAHEEIVSSDPTARHQWMLKWSALLYGMIRNECITEATFYSLRDTLVEKFKQICATSGTPRVPTERELGDAFAYGLRRAQIWDEDKLRNELRHHVHRDFDEQFEWMQGKTAGDMIHEEFQQLAAELLPNTGAQLPALPALVEQHGDTMNAALNAVAYAEPPAPSAPSTSPASPVTPALAGLKSKIDALDRMKVAPRTDTGNAERLARKFAGEFIYVPDLGWMRFDGARYVRDTAGRHMERAKDVFMALYTTGSTADQKWALKSLGAGMLASAIKLAQSTPEMVHSAAQLDAQEYELCTPGGIVDLRTGTLRPVDPKVDLHTRVTAYAPDFDAVPARFLELLRWMQPDPEIQAYLQRLAGIALIGNVDYQVFPVATGKGSNGKSTLFDLELGAIGEYGIRMPNKFLVEKPHQDHPTEMAQLMGIRLAVNAEVPPTAKFNEDLVKTLASERTIRARFMRADYIDIPNTCLQVMTANHLPSVVGGGWGFWRRVRKIAFNALVEEGKQNPRLVAEILDAEGPAILAWMITGAVEVIAHGEQVPKQVRVATSQYQMEEDAIGRFIEQHMTPVPGAACSRDSVYSIYRTWAIGEGVNTLPRQKFDREILTRLPDAQGDATQDHVYVGQMIATNISFVGEVAS